MCLNKITSPNALPLFTAEEHLQVQQRIEFLAHALWYADGCRPNTALNDWLDAEREVLAQFAYSRACEQEAASWRCACASGCRRQKTAGAAGKPAGPLRRSSLNNSNSPAAAHKHGFRA